jgi:integrase
MAIIEIHGAKSTRFKTVYRGTDKKQHVAGTFATRKEAERAYKQAMHRVGLGLDTRPVKPTMLYAFETKHGITLATYAADWLRDHPIGAHAKENYQAILDCKLLPELGHTALADIDVPTVKAMFRAMEKAGASNAYLAKTKTVLSALMQTASEDPKLPAVAFNPVRGIRVNGTRPERRKAISKTEFAKLLAELPEHYRLLARTIAASGIRQEEAAGLRDTALEITDAGCWLHITHVLVETRYPLEHKLRPGTKTGGVRRVKIDPRLAQELAALPPGFMFTRPDGRHISSDSFRKLVWRPAVKRAGLPAAFTPRDLRRCHATWLKEGHADLEDIRERLGHSSISITDRYLGQPQDAGDAALDALGDIPSDVLLSTFCIPICICIALQFAAEPPARPTRVRDPGPLRPGRVAGLRGLGVRRSSGV